MSGIVGNNVGRDSGIVKAAAVGADAITGDELADDVINSEHYVAGSIDLEHMSSESVDEDNLHISNAGSNGQYLQKQSGNAGGLTWADAGGGGAWNLIGTSVASDSASLTVTGMSSTYDTYVVVLSDIIPATDGSEAQLQLGDSSGIDSGTDYAFHTSYLIETSASYAAQVSAGAAYIKLNPNVGNAPGEGMSATVFLGTPTDTSLMNLVYGSCISSRSAGQLQGSNIWARRLTSIALTQALFKFNSGNVTSGRMSIYGIAHA